MKSCKDCRHFHEHTRISVRDRYLEFCTVMGFTQAAGHIRSNEKLCGLEAKLFEPKKEKKWLALNGTRR